MNNSLSIVYYSKIKLNLLIGLVLIAQQFVTRLAGNKYSKFMYFFLKTKTYYVCEYDCIIFYYIIIIGDYYVTRL
jgi:hypothetical protein